MPTSIDAARFLSAPGLQDWSVDGTTARIAFRTGDFATGARFVAEIAALADALDHHPDVLVAYSMVEVRTHTHSTGGLTTRDVELAQRVTEAAASRGYAAVRRG